jgi:glyoxylate/hydroxypyruvate reductase A
MATEETGQRMGEYVCWAVLSLLRDARRMSDAQAARQWDNFEVRRSAWETRVGILGMGNLGSATAAMLRNVGFVTAGWSRSPKAIPGVESFSGDATLPAFLARTDVVVCLLPSTPATQNILNAAAFACMPEGAAVVNVGRGSHVALADLIAALDSGHLSGAVLDVFDPEPLPADNPVWTHPKIILTPHVASLASRRERVRYVAASIAAFERGEPLPNMYQPERGY